MQVKFYAQTNIGNVRENNEDNYYLDGYYKRETETDTEERFGTRRTDGCLFAVFDGMGGEANGELASLASAETLKKYQDASARELAESYFDEANEAVCRIITRGHGARSGSTAAILLIRDSFAYCVNIGDSRIYFVRGGVLSMLSKDHTELQQMLDSGLVRPEVARARCSRNVLTQHIGIFRDEMLIEPHEAEPIRLADGDRFLVCSDGLTGKLSDEDLRIMFSLEMDTVSFGRELIHLALGKGERDNITVLTVDIADDGTD